MLNKRRKQRALDTNVLVPNPSNTRYLIPSRACINIEMRGETSSGGGRVCEGHVGCGRNICSKPIYSNICSSTGFLSQWPQPPATKAFSARRLAAWNSLAARFADKQLSYFGRSNLSQTCRVLKWNRRKAFRFTVVNFCYFTNHHNRVNIHHKSDQPH